MSYHFLYLGYFDSINRTPLMIVDQICEIRSTLTYHHLPQGTVFGVTFSSKSNTKYLSLGHSSKAVDVFKGELSDEEVASYLTILNNKEEKGLSLILEDKENIESVQRDENLWIQLKETTGFQPGGLINILEKVVSIEYVEDMKCREDIKRFCQERYEEIFEKVKSETTYFLTHHFHRGSIFNNSEYTDFLQIASNNYLKGRNYDSNASYWDCRYILYDDKAICIDSNSKIKDNSTEGIPFLSPKAISKPVADAMWEVLKI